MTQIRNGSDHHNVVHNFRTAGVVSVVIHRGSLISTNLVQPNCAKHFCLECTVLKEGSECELFTKALVNVAYVGAFITTSKSYIIVCEVESSSGISYVARPHKSHTVSLSQPRYGHSQQSMTQEMELLHSRIWNRTFLAG